YPVLYMHDGQNLFADSTSFIGEWHVDETLDSLYKATGLALIVVGIDNGGEHRINEYTSWTHQKYGGGEGPEYAAFIVNELKLMIDSTYRTQVDNNAILGSSLGGLISHYMIYTYPEVFSKAGIFSPSYWFSEEVITFTETHSFSKEHKIYSIMGDKEGEQGLKAFDLTNEIMKGSKYLIFKHRTIPGGEHNETFWSQQLADCIVWLYKEEL
ncbi:alpha/beta hydrolase, partial [Fulvivirga sp. RKSG066]|uniref:alpha/beta hydrolase n=1 Tax=Fulvivirga aurantia TaxID=2529383 RepID=UPI0012BCB844